MVWVFSQEDIIKFARRRALCKFFMFLLWFSRASFGFYQSFFHLWIKQHYHYRVLESENRTSQVERCIITTCGRVLTGRLPRSGSNCSGLGVDCLMKHRKNKRKVKSPNSPIPSLSRVGSFNIFNFYCRNKSVFLSMSLIFWKRKTNKNHGRIGTGSVGKKSALLIFFQRSDEAA